MKYEIEYRGQWLEVSKEIFRSWTGKRKKDGKVYDHPDSVYYYLSNKAYKANESSVKEVAG